MKQLRKENKEKEDAKELTSGVEIENYITFLKENFKDEQKNVPKCQKRQNQKEFDDFIARMKHDYIQWKK